jgi:hypothetical protein
MIIQLGELREITEGLNELLGKEIPVKPAYWFGKLAKKIQKEVVEFEENRMKLVNKYAIKDDNGQPVAENGKYQFNNQEEFQAEFKELVETDIEIDFNPISLDLLGDVKLSPVVMIGLEKFLEE